MVPKAVKIMTRKYDLTKNSYNNDHFHGNNYYSYKISAHFCDILGVINSSTWLEFVI